MEAVLDASLERNARCQVQINGWAAGTILGLWSQLFLIVQAARPTPEVL